MAVTYYAILTTVGAAKLANAAALGTTLQITQMAVGDGGGNVPVPDANRTTLVNEVRRAPLNQLKIDPGNASQIIAEQVIPETVGGWWIREIGLLDNTGALIAIANCAPSYKPQLAEGSGRTQTVRMVLIVNNTGAVELKIDPSVVLATREYVDSAIVTAINRQDAKASVRAATTANIALNGLLTVDGVVLVAGDRVLVKNQAIGSQNGIYVAAAGAWARSSDADENAEVTPSLTVSVESGTTQADTIWQLITDAPVLVGTTALVFQDITNGLARLASPAFTGTPSAPTATPGTNTQQLANTAFVQTAIANLVASSPATLDTLNELAAALGNDPNFATTMATQLGLKAPLASPVFTGTPAAPTAVQDTSTTQVATTDFVMKQAATQAEAEAGTSTTRWMSPLRVLQTIAKVVVQATEAIAGIAKIATQAQTNAGTDDATIVTPKKLRAGFSMLLATNGYIALPTWLGGFIFQWGQVVTNSSGDAIATFPLAFPYAYLGAWPSYNSNANNSVSYTLRSLTKTQVYFGAQFSGTTTAAPGANTYYLAIGY